MSVHHSLSFPFVAKKKNYLKRLRNVKGQAVLLGRELGNVNIGFKSSSTPCDFGKIRQETLVAKYTGSDSLWNAFGVIL